MTVCGTNMWKLLSAEEQDEYGYYNVILQSTPSLKDVVVSTELIPEHGMDSRPLSMKSKLPISLTNVFTSEFTVSFNSERHLSDGTHPQARDFESRRLPIDARLPVSLSTFKFAVSLIIELMQQEGAALVSQNG